MDIDWNKYMKDHHIKIYTEEELKKKRQKAVFRKAIIYSVNHINDVLESRIVPGIK